jgi:hypothetical protein
MPYLVNLSSSLESNSRFEPWLSPTEQPVQDDVNGSRKVGVLIVWTNHVGNFQHGEGSIRKDVLYKSRQERKINGVPEVFTLRR